MDSITQKQMSKILMKCAIYWPSAFKDKDDENYAKMMTVAWTEALAGYSYDDIVRAFTYLVRTSKFMPSVAEVIDTIESNSDGAQTGKEAYAHCAQLARRYGYCDEESALAEMNNVERAAIREIGWYNFCTNDDPRQFRIKDFESRYDVHKERARHESLIGGIPDNRARLEEVKKRILDQNKNLPDWMLDD